MTCAVPGIRSAGVLAVVPVPFLDTPRPHAFAHRGGAARTPENSWTAFEYAVKLGYSYLETDARATSDGRLMAFHDRTLDRVTDGSGPIGSRAYQEVKALRVGGLGAGTAGRGPARRLARGALQHRPEGRGPGIALLADVLRRTGASDRVCVTSFSGSRLRAARGLLDRPVCMATSPAVIAAVRYTVGSTGQGGQVRAGRQPGLLARRLAHSQVRCAQVRPGWPRARSSGALTPSASTCTCGPSTTGPR